MSSSESAPESAAPTPGIDQAKKTLRREAAQRRAAAAAAHPEAGDKLCAALLAAVEIPRDAAVSAYWPMREEIDPRPAMRALHARGHPVALPVMPGKAQPLVFRAWCPDQEMVDGGFGTRIPPAEAPEIQPQILLVPLLAFDADGYRLGYGGGFYDRTLARLRRLNPLTRGVGVAYAAQRTETPLPRGAYDEPLDLVVTEQGVALRRDGRG